MIDEVEFWGKLKHENIVKVFTWYEDYKTPDNPNPYDCMYLMMQFADLGQIMDFDEDTEVYSENPKVISYLTNKLTQEYEFLPFGLPECLTMKERIAMFIF